MSKPIVISDDEDEDAAPAPSSKASIKRRKTDPAETARLSQPFLLASASFLPLRYNEKHMTISLKEILALDDDELVSSVQFTYMVDLAWLVSQYQEKHQHLPLHVVTGDPASAYQEDVAENPKLLSHVSFIRAPHLAAYGTHHTKMMLLFYKKNMRIVVTTANLLHGDWNLKTQAIWISPLFPRTAAAPPSRPSRVGTGFGQDMFDYLLAYGPVLKDIRDHVAQHDMSMANVRVIASVPGTHVLSRLHDWGHMKLRKELGTIARASTQPTLICQFSSIGSLGSHKEAWLCGEFKTSLSASLSPPPPPPQQQPSSSSSSASSASSSHHHAHTPDPLLVYPTVENVRESVEGYCAGGSLPFNDKNATRMPYMSDLAHVWGAEWCGRTLSMPHVKTYLSIDLRTHVLDWCLVTSANLSKAAWGALQKSGSQLSILSYELGVLITPQDTGLELRLMQDHDDKAAPACWLPIPYDIPLTKYKKGHDQIWVVDRKYTRPDSQGLVWPLPRD